MRSQALIYENGNLVLKGPMSQADVRNRNGRIYPKDVLREAVFDLIARVNREPQEVYSELEHPQSTVLERRKSCGLLTEVTWDENEGIAYCKVEIFPDTVTGQKVLKGHNNGETYGISTRSLGSLNEDQEVQPGLKIITSDVIQTHGMQSCQICDLNEGTENTLDDFFIEEKCDCVFDKLDIAGKVEVRQHVVDRICSIFEGE